MDMWIKFANLCRKNGRMTLAEKTLNSLMGGEDTDFSSHPSSSGPPHVIYAHLKFMWTRGDKAETLSYLDDFTNRLAHDLGIGNGSTRPTELTQSGQVTTFTRLLARCYYKQASWSMELQDDWGSVGCHQNHMSLLLIERTGACHLGSCCLQARDHPGPFVVQSVAFLGSGKLRGRLSFYAPST